MKTVLVSGAAKGIGRACTEYLAARDYRVFAGVRRKGDAPKSENVREVILDVTNADDIQNAANSIRAAGWVLNALVNNAGLVVPAPLEYLALDEFRYQLEVNLTGQLAITQAMLPMLKESRGRIVLMSSVAGRISTGLMGAYHASKYAMEALGDTLRLELAPWAVKTILIEPGAIATPIWKTAIARMESGLNESDSKMIKDYGAAIRKKRDLAMKANQRGLSPVRVARIVEHALRCRYPRARYIIGLDSWLSVRILSKLPPFLKDPIVRTQIR